MNSSLLISAFVGALLSAALSFVVRRVLDTRTQREAERKLAYVILVRISSLVAVESAVRRAFKDRFQIATSNLAQTESEGYGPSHRASAVVAFILSDLVPEKTLSEPQFKAIPRLVRRILENARESRFSPEQLAKLPRQAIVSIEEFQDYHSQMCDVAAIWGDYFEHGDRSWVTPEGVFGHWRILAVFLERASRARDVLVEYGAATRTEADDLLRTQRGKLELMLAANAVDKPQIAAAAADLPFARKYRADGA